MSSGIIGSKGWRPKRHIKKSCLEGVQPTPVVDSVHADFHARPGEDYEALVETAKDILRSALA